jgi:shikimate dehydrogenase
MTAGRYLSGHARLAGIMGAPIGHSRSPRLHGYWLEQHGIDGAYLPFHVAPEALEQALRALPALGIKGVNLTIPHKEAGLRLVDEVSATARRIGAVNTIIVQEDGSLFGDNTDAFGFRAHLEAELPDRQWAVAGPAVVLGAGGAARAVAVALLDMGFTTLRLVNRTAERAEALAETREGRAAALPWAERSAALAGAALLVNTTSLGMKGQPPLEIALDRLPGDALVTDIVYTPLETPLLAAARTRGHATVDGLGMLLHQGRPGFHACFGVDPEVTPALRRVMLEP